MSAPNSNLIWRTFGANRAPNNPGALKGKHLAQMRAKSRVILRTNGAFPFLGAPGKLVGCLFWMPFA